MIQACNLSTLARILHLNTWNAGQVAFIFDLDVCVHVHSEVSRRFRAWQLEFSSFAAFKDGAQRSVQFKSITRVLPTPELRRAAG